MNNEKMVLSQLTSRIYRCTQAYANEVLEKYQLGSGTYPFLLTLYCKEGINQNQLSKELGVDKAMSARAIKHLIEIGYLKKEENLVDLRAFKLYLTDQAKAIVPAVKEEMQKWNEMITQNLTPQEQELVIDLLTTVLKDAKICKNK